MAAQTVLPPAGTLDHVTDDLETTGQRIRRLRKSLGWTQEDLEAAVDGQVKLATIGNIERDVPAPKGRGKSIATLEKALEDERMRREHAAEPTADDRQLVEFIANARLEDVRLRRGGRHRKTRFLTAVIPDPDATPEQVQQDIEDWYREQRHRDEPNG